MQSHIIPRNSSKPVSLQACRMSCQTVDDQHKISVLSSPPIVISRFALAVFPVRIAMCRIVEGLHTVKEGINMVVSTKSQSRKMEYFGVEVV